MSNHNDRMAPDSSPNSPDQYGGRRVNNLPLIILGACLIGFLAIVVIVGMDRAKIRDQGKEKIAKAESSTNMARQLIGDMEAGYIPPPKLAEVKEEMPAEVPETVKETPQPFTNLKQPEESKKVDPWEAERKLIRQHNFKILTAAIKAPTAVDFTASTFSKSQSVYGGSGYSNAVGSNIESKREQLLAKIKEATMQANLAAKTDPTAAYKARLAILKNSGLDSGKNSGKGAGSLLGGNNSENSLLTSDSESNGDWTLNNKIEDPATPFTLRAGFVIPGIMITGINSELAGKIIGQISQNVYDTATGTQLLLPQGTRLLGQYANDVAYGQSRILIAWNRLIFPDGKTLDIGSMPGTDSAGYSGFHDQVDNHYFRIFGSALLLSGITAVMSYTLDDDSETTDTERPFSDSLSEALASNLGEVSLAMIRKNLNIAPTLKIRPGYRFNIMVVKDIVFGKTFQPFDY